MRRKKRHQKRRRLPRLPFVLFALAALVVVHVFRACAARSARWDEQGWNESYYASESYADQDCFVAADGRITYSDGSLALTTTGVDVSDHQGYIDWDEVAADGIDFAFIRVGYRGNTEGRIHADTQFEQNLSGARAAGISCGVYFYSQAVTEQEAREEAQFVLDSLASRGLAYPVVFDYELNDGNRLAGLDPATATACAAAFCATIRAGGYQDVALYGNTYDLQRLYLSELDCRVWLAQYAPYPSHAGTFAIWQYTNAGQVRGIDTPIDLNLDLSELSQPAEGLRLPNLPDSH